MMESPRADDEARLIRAAMGLARRIQERAVTLQTPQERRQQAELDRMIQHPADKATLVQSKRSANPVTPLGVFGVGRAGRIG